MFEKSFHIKNIIGSIKSINPLETYTIRHPILRKGRPIEDCHFDGDNLETTIHLGLYIETKLIGVCTFLKQNHHLFSKTAQYQLRGMAILKEFQGKGWGHVILKYGERLLKKEGTQIIWCHVREKAINFCKKNNYNVIGNPFSIENIGVHFVMYKIL